MGVEAVASFLLHRRVQRAPALPLVIVFALLASSCAGTTPIESLPGSVVSPTTSPPSSATTSPIASEIVGFWHRAHTCEEMLAAFEAAGLAESHVGWLQGNFYGGEPGPTGDDPCAGASGPLEHSHWFTADGEFGSHDENGEEVDGGDYVAVDADTLSFPSHANEFGYEDELVVDYVIEDEVVFDVTLPEQCDAPCQEAYALALSAFASGPWAKGDVP